MKYALASCFFFFLLLCTLQGQQLTAVESYWSDSFDEWVLFDETGEESGNLRLRWRNRLDEWDFEFGELSGSFQLKWRDDPSLWELRANGNIVTAEMLWKGDVREWRIYDGKRKLTLRSRWSNRLDEWTIRDNQYGEFRIITTWEFDPRSWEIEDHLSEEISTAMKLTMVFVAIFQAIPK